MPFQKSVVQTFEKAGLTFEIKVYFSNTPSHTIHFQIGSSDTVPFEQENVA